MTVRITEAVKAAAPTGARTLITLITPGWGSSGYYSAEMLEQAAKDVVFPAGTQMHIDHEKDGGVGSVSTLAAVLAEDAHWDPDYLDPDTGNKGRLAAPNEVFSHKREMLKEMKDVIGTSIAAAAEVSLGEAEGRSGRIIEKLLPSPLNRVDYVTVAGRGGRISEVLESYAGQVTELTADDTRVALLAAIRDAYASDTNWVWLRDHDETNVWFEQEGPNTQNKTWQQSYTLDGATATLSGELVEVRRVTTYVPVVLPSAAESAAPIDSPSIPAGVTEKKEPTMATIQIEESVHADLVEKSSRTTALESKVSVTEAALKESNDEAATELVTSALESAGFKAPKLAARLAEGYPVKENGVIDRAVLSQTVAEAVAELQVAEGAGSVRGVGEPKEKTETTVTLESATEAILAHRGITPKGAK